MEDSFAPANAQNFVKDYKQKAAAIVPGEYTSELDCTTMQVVTKEMIPELEACYVLYENSGFQKVVFQIKENLVLKMQLSRLARTSGLDQAEVTEV